MAWNVDSRIKDGAAAASGEPAPAAPIGRGRRGGRAAGARPECPEAARGPEPARKGRLGSWGWGTAVFAVALLVRAAYVIESRAHPDSAAQGFLMDSLYYQHYALRAASGELLGPYPYFLAPLYQHVMALVYAVAGKADRAAVLALQAVLGALSCALLYTIGRRVFSPAAGVLAGAMLALYGLHVFYTALLLPTVLVVFVNLLFVLALLPPGRPLSWRRAAGAGALAGLAITAKENALLLLPAGAAAIAVAERALPARARAGRIGLLLLCAALVVAPATLHNLLVADAFVLVTTSGGRNLMKGNGPSATGTHAPPGVEEAGYDVTAFVFDLATAENAVADDRALRRAAIDYMLAHPAATAALLARKLMLFVNAVELAVRDQYYFWRARSTLLSLPLPGFGWVVPFGLAGMLLALRETRRSAVLYAVIAAQVVSFVAVFVLARYRLVAVALCMPFAAWLVLSAPGWIRARRLQRLAGGAALLAAAFAIVHWPLPELPRERGFAIQHELVGDASFADARYEHAISAYRAALGSDWQDENEREKRTKCRVQIAAAQLLLGRYAEAQGTLKSVLAQQPRDPTALLRKQRRVAARLMGIAEQARRTGAPPERVVHLGAMGPRTVRP